MTTPTPPPPTPAATVLVFDGQNSLVVLDQPLPSLPGGVTVEFWARGGDDLPRTTSVFASWRADDARILNIHLPWSDGVVYWDAGSDGGGYDRIQKAAKPVEYKGSWAHWAFVKDVAKQEMSIYRNGALWHRAGGRRGRWPRAGTPTSARTSTARTSGAAGSPSSGSGTGRAPRRRSAPTGAAG